MLFADQVKFVIPTHDKSRSLALGVLLPSLIRTNLIPPSAILVVVNDSPRRKTEVKGGITYQYVTHNSYEYGALIEVVEGGWESPYWFLLHDTTWAGPRFFPSVLEKGADSPCILADARGWMNIGLYSHDFLRECSNFILSLRDCGKMRAIFAERLLARMGRADTYGDGQATLGSIPNVIHPSFPHHTRQPIYFPALDLTKFQLYHGRSEELTQLLKENGLPDVGPR